MAKGFTSGGVDFDDLFEPEVGGNGVAAAWLTSGGVALRYARLQYGTKRADVGFRDSNGVDVSNLWAAKGSVSYLSALPFNGQNFNALDQAFTSAGTVQAVLALSIAANGNYSITRQIGSAQGTQIASGTWNTYGAPASDFEVLFTVTHTGGSHVATVGNGAAAYANLATSRGVQTTLGPYPASDTTNRTSIESIRIQIRRISTGLVVSDTTATFSTQTTGFA